MSRTLLVLSLLAGFLLPTAAAQAARPLGLPSAEALMFTVQAERGTLQPVRGTRDRFVLTLKDVASQAVWFSDRPARNTGSVAVDTLVAGWKRLGFRADPPNAVVSVTKGRRKADMLAVELGVPHYDRRRGTVRLRVRALNQLPPGLAHLGRDVDGSIPRRFGQMTLFIDDVIVPNFGTGGCLKLAELDLYPAGFTPQGYVAAAGQLVTLWSSPALFSLLGTRFGGDGATDFMLPAVSAPAGLQYNLCAGGAYPVSAGSGSGADPTCATGSVTLDALPFQPDGWVPADGRTLQISQASSLYAVVGTAFGGDGTTTFGVPSLAAPAGLSYYVCANGTDWKAGPALCTIGQVQLFATTTLPTSYLPADGRTVQTTSFIELYQILANQYGGQGYETFGLPSPPPPAPGTAYGICSAGVFPNF
jgi:microcystin-dependent protein